MENCAVRCFTIRLIGITCVVPRLIIQKPRKRRPKTSQTMWQRMVSTSKPTSIHLLAMLSMTCSMMPIQAPGILGNSVIITETRGKFKVKVPLHLCSRPQVQTNQELSEMLRSKGSMDRGYWNRRDSRSFSGSYHRDRWFCSRCITLAKL